MTKSEIRNLEKRVNKISSPTRSEANPELGARNRWICSHLTQDEFIALIQGMKHLMDARPGTATEQEMDTVHSILLKGEERAAKEPCEAWEEYRWKYIRAENLRRSQRHLTNAEDHELDEINLWLERRVRFHLETGKMGSYYLK